jgi:hypothetical protein
VDKYLNDSKTEVNGGNAGNVGNVTERGESSNRLTTQTSRVGTANRGYSSQSIARQFTFNSTKSINTSNKTIINFKKNHTTEICSLSRNIANVELLPTQATDISELVTYTMRGDTRRPTVKPIFKPIFKPYMSNKELLNTISGEYRTSESLKKQYSSKFNKLNSSVKVVRKKFTDEINKDRNDMIKLMQEDYVCFEKDSLGKKTKEHFNDYTFNAISKIKENTAFQANSLLRVRIGLFNKFDQSPQDFKLNITNTSTNQHNIKCMIKSMNIKKDQMLVRNRKSRSSSTVFRKGNLVKSIKK